MNHITDDFLTKNLHHIKQAAHNTFLTFKLSLVKRPHLSPTNERIPCVKEMIHHGKVTTSSITGTFHYGYTCVYMPHIYTNAHVYRYIQNYKLQCTLYAVNITNRYMQLKVAIQRINIMLLFKALGLLS